jgi:hypothetical protein
VVGIPELLVLSIFVVPILTVVVVSVVLLVALIRRMRRQSREHGYPTLKAYLRAAPRTDAEKRDAADLALKGLVICLLGLILPPLMLIGLFPLFYGVRKVVYASMGLGLADDAIR